MSSFMFEVFLPLPVDREREKSVRDLVESEGGRLTVREEPEDTRPSKNVCLTFEFEDYEMAGTAADRLSRIGEHVEGPSWYGDDLRPELPRS